jgi:hypothetical protein
MPTATQSRRLAHDTDAKEANPFGKTDAAHVRPPSVLVNAAAVPATVLPTAVQVDGDGQLNELSICTVLGSATSCQVRPKSAVAQAPALPALVVPTATQLWGPGHAMASTNQPSGGR